MPREIIGVRALDSTVLAVATKGTVGDWTAYIRGVPGMCHEKEAEEVAQYGNKLPKKIAEMLFPDLAEEYTWRE